MGKPIEHAENSVKKYGGEISDYIFIHEFLDSSQAAVANLKHRALTHNSWFINVIIPKCFGQYVTNSDGKNISTIGICEDHIFEDLNKIPSAQDWLDNLQWKDWMKNLKNTEPAPSPDRSLADAFEKGIYPNPNSVVRSTKVNNHDPTKAMIFSSAEPLVYFKTHVSS